VCGVAVRSPVVDRAVEAALGGDQPLRELLRRARDGRRRRGRLGLRRGRPGPRRARRRLGAVPASASAAAPAAEGDREYEYRYTADSSAFAAARIWKARIRSVTPWKSAQMPANTSSV
jgi:hypothetical protein